MLEERGIVGPADGAKPREIYGEQNGANRGEDSTSVQLISGGGLDESEAAAPEEDSDWKKV